MYILFFIDNFGLSVFKLVIFTSIEIYYAYMHTHRYIYTHTCIYIDAYNFHQYYPNGKYNTYVATGFMAHKVCLTFSRVKYYRTNLNHNNL